jgi:DNA-binding transcriptional LysR family regulator
MYSAADATGLQAAAMTACEAAGFLPKIAQEATQVPTVLALVESGLGIALVPEVMRGHREPQVVYRRLQDAGEALETTLVLAWLGGSEIPAAQRFIQLAMALELA